MKMLRMLRKSNGMSQDTLSKQLGVSRSTVAMWETGQSAPDIYTLKQLAEMFSVTVDMLIGNESNAYAKSVKIPVLGKVAAGIPITAVENVLDYEELDSATAKKGEYFALKIDGSSMEPRMMAGDVVIVRQQPDVENGEIAIVMVNSEDATCKKIVKHEKGISLVSYNPVYPPMFYTNEEIASLPVTILGKVVELRGKF